MIKKPKAAHEKLYQELCAVMQRYEGAGMSLSELLAINSQVAGKLIAMLDPLKYSVSAAMETVQANIEIGNRQMINYLSKMRVKQ